MRVVTFYSFKGGVGRSLALVNVGAELAQTGRRVLLVDFDLEAPGLHTFKALRPSESRPGIIDFVNDYVATKISPDVRDYAYEAAGVAQKGGRLWVMPAGRFDGAYKSRLAQVDWKSLYAKHDGYLLFEDLRAQWVATFNPDYVLIDSRTGHTDVQGICTRQLPDAVVILFFPNQQNLDGLKGVVADIRTESKAPRNGGIVLHFVMSNVPDLDDEEEILKRRLREFRTTLGIREMGAVIHRYDSLSLLNQTIFTRERPRSRLAKEYGKLKDALVQDNVEDREGAIQFLQLALRHPLRAYRPVHRDKFEQKCKRIAELYSADGEILFLLGEVKEREGSKEEALLWFDQALESHSLRAELTSSVYLERGELRYRLRDASGAEADVIAALQADASEDLDVERAVRLLQETNPQGLKVLIDNPTVRALSVAAKLGVVHELSRTSEGLATAVGLLQPLVEDAAIPVEERRMVRHELTLALIGLGRLEEAIGFLEPLVRESDEITHLFNIAMARWGLSGAPDKALFERVLAKRSNDDHGHSANYEQCLSIASWACGNLTEALERLSKAEGIMKEIKYPGFSCWRYKRVKWSEFLEDCASVRQLMAGARVKPAFVANTE